MKAVNGSSMFGAGAAIGFVAAGLILPLLRTERASQPVTASVLGELRGISIRREDLRSHIRKCGHQFTSEHQVEEGGFEWSTDSIMPEYVLLKMNGPDHDVWAVEAWMVVGTDSTLESTAASVRCISDILSGITPRWDDRDDWLQRALLAARRDMSVCTTHGDLNVTLHSTVQQRVLVVELTESALRKAQLNRD